MKAAVLDSGGGGLAVAFDYAAHGHDVYLFDFEKFPGDIGAVRKNEGIHSEGQLKGFAHVAYAGHDIEKTLKNADLVMLVGSAYSTRPFA
jgi:opine dehydrogenase